MLSAGRLLVILGPTAVGKTGLAMQLAEALNGEIIGADSRQIYRYMDIGTAKPTLDQRAQIPHHLIDIVDPDETIPLSEVQARTYAAIDDILKRGKLPLLVGGTGQYITAVVEGWSIPTVPPNETLRTELELEAELHGADALHTRLATLDPEAAEKIHPNNVRRVIRALEVCLETGTPITELQRKKPPPYDIRLHGLHLDRDALYARADNRVDQMMADGLLDEVRALLARGYDPKLPAMSGIGYRQLVDYLQEKTSLDEAIESIKTVTHDFIRRQYTWFRGHDSGILWHNSAEIRAEQLTQEIAHWMEG